MDQVAMLQHSLAAYEADPDRPRTHWQRTLLPETPPVGADPVTWRVVAADVVAVMAQTPAPAGVMNFASPITPGGGVEFGIVAQEQSIAKCTYLLPELRQFAGSYYAQNQAARDYNGLTAQLLYTAHCRQVLNAMGAPLVAHYLDVVTIADPNRRQFMNLPETQALAAIEAQINQTLRAFKAHGVRHLILGAYGTGAFGNPVAPVAECFARQLRRAEFRGAFATVVFAVTGRSAAAFAQAMPRA
ncbi:TIGR02452 family protein [Lacticaseibacillus daqingensis]|uniref:TIGR02452 family protein n=1 Tax=Lacticaseibacillus daqingensis TaxID=2486014 RepID=UPI0013DDE1D0|nr:TIGR02452 family protein [Lacticaseibacillus daqingensis]